MDMHNPGFPALTRWSRHWLTTSTPHAMLLTLPVLPSLERWRTLLICLYFPWVIQASSQSIRALKVTSIMMAYQAELLEEGLQATGLHTLNPDAFGWDLYEYRPDPLSSCSAIQGCGHTINLEREGTLVNLVQLNRKIKSGPSVCHSDTQWVVQAHRRHHAAEVWHA